MHSTDGGTPATAAQYRQFRRPAGAKISLTSLQRRIAHPLRRSERRRPAFITGQIGSVDQSDMDS
ncbi:hypothetical protein QYS42_00290, partial [Klebsiella pneumoniae]|uniref:hypothetical protein n=1 Tax=Klebsiella pneumoniae TaxID=573 RepID=UPI00287C2FDB